jgi:hypothetical protein
VTTEQGETDMAKYLILIYGDEREWEETTPGGWDAKNAAHRAFATAAGPGLLGGGELESRDTATTLRPGSPGSSGAPAITDGPFLETKEALGGFYLVDVPDLDAAILLVSRLPELAERSSAVEIRPLHDNG